MKNQYNQTNIIIRKYSDRDFKQVLHLFALNTPTYFSPGEKESLVFYLTHEIEHYFVLELDRVLVGSGGFNFPDRRNGRISWDMIHPDFQGRSLGTLLLRYRIERLKEFKEVDTITVRTSQFVYQFYEKSGFKLVEQVKDYWAKGFDLYRMEMDMF